MAVACADIEVLAVGGDRPEDVLGEGTAVGAEVPDQDAALPLQAVEKPLQCVGLTELDVGIAVAVLHSDDEAADRRHTREVTVGFLVGVFRILLVRGDELMVEVELDAVPGIELAALVGDAVLRKPPQRAQDDI